VASESPTIAGSAVHAFLAADRPELDEEDRRDVGARVLGGWGVASALALGDRLAMGERFLRWLSGRWPIGRVRREWPVEHRLREGAVARVEVEAVVEAESVLVLIDHKVIVAGEARALEAAAGYVGQLHLPLSGLVAYVGEPTPELTAPPRPASRGT
jgi:hypothetical protein